MKVILIKDCKDGKANSIIEVADGYGKNFLIKKGFALPVNQTTKHAHDQKVANLEAMEKKAEVEALALKEKLEALTLKFKLKVTNDKIHHSITRKQILQQLKLQNINLDTHALEHVKINTLGLNLLKVKLTKKINANLKVEVEPDGK